LVTASSFKTFSADGLPCRRLQLPAAPTLVYYLHEYHKLVKGDKYYFGMHKNKAACGKGALKVVSELLGRTPLPFGVHSLKRGTVSYLRKQKLSIEDINAHVGWAYNSSEFQRYFRFV
jgi:hypothetical protein